MIQSLWRSASGNPGIRPCLPVLSLSALLLAVAAAAQTLTDFREPNPLELVYLGLAADLVDPGLCERISPNALHRVRKPALVRSRCFYYLAVNSGELKWCDRVEPIPVGAGVMNWLDPERCRYQAGRLLETGQRFPVPFDPSLLFAQLGLTEADVSGRFGREEAPDWAGFYRFVANTDNREAHADFRRRLQSLPDFSRSEPAEDQKLYYTEQQQEREFDWVVARGMRLCIQGRLSPNCRQEFAKLREQGSAALPQGRHEAGRADTTPRSGFLRASEIDKARYDMAMRLGDADLCRAIAPRVLAIGWTVDPGFLFMPLRSICLAGVAVTTRNASLCEEVQPLPRPDLEGEGLTPGHCRHSIDRTADSPHRTTLKPDWERALQALGLTDAQIPDKVGRGGNESSRWLAFADYLATPDAPQGRILRERLRQIGTAEDADRHLTEGDLQRHLYQLSVIRFHCSINRFGDRYLYKGYSLAAPKKFGGPFELVDQNGKRVTDEDFHGRYLLVFFGYTACPDICPTNLVTIASTLKRLGGLGEQIQPLFVGVDTKRDTPENLGAYTAYFHPRILGVTGTAEQVRRAAKAYEAHYFAGEVDGNYVVDHTAWTYFVGPDGRPIGYFDHGTSAADMAAEIRKVLGGQEKLAAETAGG